MTQELKTQILAMLEQNGEMTTDQIATKLYPVTDSHYQSKRNHDRTYRILVWLRKWEKITSIGTRGRDMVWRLL